MRAHKATIYFLISIIVMLVGIGLLYPFKENAAVLSIATSLIAGGLASMAFGLIRYFDDIDNDKTGKTLGDRLHSLGESLALLDDDLEAIRHFALLALPPNEKRIYDRHPEAEIRKVIDGIRKTIEIDVIALTLRPFCQDFLDRLYERGNVSLRLLCQDPRSEALKLICRQEGRDLEAMAEDIMRSTAEVLRRKGETIVDIPSGRDPKTVLHEQKQPHIISQIKWCSLVPSITMVRVNNVIFVRCRFLKESSHSPMFFERYFVEDGRCYDAYRHYFELAWELSASPPKELVKDQAQHGGHADNDPSQQKPDLQT